MQPQLVAGVIGHGLGLGAVTGSIAAGECGHSGARTGQRANGDLGPPTLDRMRSTRPGGGIAEHDHRHRSAVGGAPRSLSGGSPVEHLGGQDDGATGDQHGAGRSPADAKGLHRSPRCPGWSGWPPASATPAARRRDRRPRTGPTLTGSVMISKSPAATPSIAEPATGHAVLITTPDTSSGPVGGPNRSGVTARRSKRGVDQARANHIVGQPLFAGRSDRQIDVAHLGNVEIATEGLHREFLVRMSGRFSWRARRCWSWSSGRASLWVSGADDAPRWVAAGVPSACRSVERARR